MKIKTGKAVANDVCAWCDYKFDIGEDVLSPEKYLDLVYCTKTCMMLNLVSEGLVEINFENVVETS